MTSQLQQAIDLAQSLSFAEQLELLKILSALIQETHARQTQNATAEADTDFCAESFRQSWQQAMTGETLPLSQLCDSHSIPITITSLIQHSQIS
jgi:hypothetical protein